MHYGHPDVFDRIFHITRGGISKASKQINLSQDIFAGLNSCCSSFSFKILLYYLHEIIAIVWARLYFLFIMKSF